jgi:hypothetical protein
LSLVAVSALATGGLLIPQSAQAHPAQQGRAAGDQPTRGAMRQAPTVAKQLGGPGVWTKFSSGIVDGFAQVALVRTPDGKLHAAWVRKNKLNDFDIRSTTFSLTGAVVHNGAALSHWLGFDQSLALVPDGKGVRLVFTGGQDGNSSNKFSLGTVYTATSANGISWTLVNGSLSSHTVFNGEVAATTRLNGTPVASEELNATSYFHVGVDSSIPAASADKTFTHGSAFFIGNESLTRDKTDTVYAAWYEGSNTARGYWVRPIVPAVGAALLAPHSKDVGLATNEPRQPVALTARTGGGVYMAYCVATKTATCAHIDLWKVGASTVKVVPGSSGSHSLFHVAIAAGAKGRIVVGWYDATKGVVKVVRTNTHATAWGVVRTIKPPVPFNQLASFSGLYLEASSGRIDVVANVTRATPALYHTQVLPGLKVTCSPRKISHTHSTVITFKVSDAGQAVAGATVTFLGHKAHTNSTGIAKITVAKGQKPGTRTATASKALYYKAAVSVKVT